MLRAHGIARKTASHDVGYPYRHFLLIFTRLRLEQMPEAVSVLSSSHAWDPQPNNINQASVVDNGTL